MTTVEFEPWDDPQEKPLIHFQNVTKRFGSFVAIDNLTIDIYEREFYALLGPSGCGKTTLMRMLAGFETPTEGNIMLAGQDIVPVPPNKRATNMMFQSYALFPHLSIWENIAFGLRREGMAKDKINDRVEEMLRLTRMEKFARRKPHQVSGGQRQRVAIGRAIVRDPNVFLFDEPLSNLDAALRVKTRVEIGKLHQELGATIIYVTHDQVEAMTLGDKIVVMNEGRVEQCGTPLELYQHPTTRFVAGFIGSPKMNFLDGLVTAITKDYLEIKLSNGTITRAHVETDQLTLGDTVTFGVRPEHMEEGSATGTVIQGEVTLVEQLGEASYIYLRLDDGSEVIIRAHGESTTTIGERIDISFNPDNGHVFDSQDRSIRRLKAGNVKSHTELAQLKAVADAC